MTTVELTQYADYLSNWFGLKDGTLLALDDIRGDWWIKVNNEVMLVDEFNFD